MKPLRTRDTRIPRRAYLWLAGALLFTLPPVFGNLAPWVGIFFLIALVTKFWMEPRGYRLRSLPLKLVLAATALTANFVTYGAIQGIEPGVSLIVVLMSMKILEAHTAREFQFMVMLGFMICLCCFFLTQGLAVALSLSVAFALLFVALIDFHGGVSPGHFWSPVRTTAKLVAQASPIILLLFLFFPRVATGFRFQIGRGGSSGTGFADRLEPGSVSSLANSSGIAFRAGFPDGQVPAPGAMYWRGSVMWQGRGLEWSAPAAPAALPRTGRPPPAAKAIRQWVTIEPHGGRWVFALDWPASPPPGVALAPGNYLWSGQPIRKQRRYEVRSYPEIREKRLHPREEKLLLDLRGLVSPRAAQLAQNWRAESNDPRQVVAAAMRFFRSEGFRYSLAPGQYPKDALDQFLFERKLGFCEHYAAAFATLMRMAGIPARVVSGYLGGEYNEMGQFYLVRQADAHAWCEVWFPDTGWERIDPTSVVAPDRVNLGLNAFLERLTNSGQTGAAVNPLARRLTRSAFFTRIRLAWQTVNYAWDSRVLSFDADAQESMVTSFRMPGRGALFFLGGISLVTASLLGLYFGWNRWRWRPERDRLKKLYDRFCARAARRGSVRQPCEGPTTFFHRVARQLPNDSELVERMGQAYVTLRYASASSRDSLLRQFIADLRTFARK